MTTLRIYFPSGWRDAMSECPWALLDDAGTVVQAGHGALASMPKAKNCIGVVAADRTLCSAIAVPPGPRRRWLSALPYLAEEHTLPDPDENHVVPGSVRSDGRQSLLITAKPWLRQIAAACRAADLPLRKMVPEIALPPVAPKAWVVVWNGRGGFVCTGEAEGLALDAGDAHALPVVLRLLLQSRQLVADKIELRFPADLPSVQKTVPQWPELPFLRGADWDWRVAPIPPQTPNLLWGELAPSARPLEWWPKLRPAAMLALVLLGIEIVTSNLQWAMLTHEKQTLEREMVQSFHQAFGNAAVVVDAPLQMQRNLADLRHTAGVPDNGDFLPLLNGAAAVLNNLPVGSIRGMHYESGRLDVEVKLGGVAEAARLQDRFRDIGMNVRVDVRDTGNGAEVRFSLRQGAMT